MGRRIANDIDEFIKIWESDLKFELDDVDEEGNPVSYHVYKYDFENIEIDFELSIPFSKEIIDRMEMKIFQNIGTIKFNDCKFLHKLYIGNSDKNIEFTNNCYFEDTIRSFRFKSNLTFKNCTIKKLNFEDAIFGDELKKRDKKGKVRFRNCDLFDINFNNATFNSLADFWSCTFHYPITFYKTDFFDIVVFSAVNFKENVLFTYTLIEKLMILRGTFPEKGFDLSLAIISGRLSVFDFQFDDFSSYHKIYKDLNEVLKKQNISYQKAYEDVYEKAVSQKHLIPIENKRETFRILKNQLESQKNFIDSIPFRVMENKTLLKESYIKLANGHTITRPISNIIVLSLNAISNWFGSSYVIGLLFTVSVAGLFFNLALSHIGDFVFTTNINDWQWRYFVQFINPTHRFDYMKLVDENPRQWFFIWDFLSRIFIGYGIYQTIQAFRKFR
tara:strand:- start:3949 stop:5283 length:1335 start_codon:yes stop_codon:yes gene_type:complete